MLPLVVGMLIALAHRALPEAHRLKGRYLWVVITVTSVICVLGVIGGIGGVLG